MVTIDTHTASESSGDELGAEALLQQILFCIKRLPTPAKQKTIRKEYIIYLMS